MEPITGDKLIALIPQKPPFVFVSKLLSVSELACSTAFTVQADSLMTEEDALSPAALIENIAQTCAAKAGYECFLEGKAIPVGFIGDLKNFSYSYLPKTGEEILTEIHIENRVFNVTIISGTVRHAGKEIAHARMKIYSEEA